MIAVTATAVAHRRDGDRRPALPPGGGSPFAGALRRGRRHSDRNPRDRRQRSPARSSSEATERPRLGYLLDLLVPLAGLPLLAPLAALDGAARAGRKPDLRDGDADVDPLPLHRESGPGASSSQRSSAGDRAAAGSAAHAAVVPRSARGRGARWRAPPTGRIPLWRHVPLGEDLAARDHVVSGRDRAAAPAIEALVPATASRLCDEHARCPPVRAARESSAFRWCARRAGSQSTRTGSATSTRSTARRERGRTSAAVGGSQLADRFDADGIRSFAERGQPVPFHRARLAGTQLAHVAFSATSRHSLSILPIE